jgi:acetyltransferase-like isoleucine patch superfamily enzyme
MDKEKSRLNRGGFWDIEHNLQETIKTPWKAVSELKMYALRPVAWLYLKVVCGVKIGPNSKFYGLPRIFRHRKSSIIIGKCFENMNRWDSNPLGINHPTIFCTWSSTALIKIGNDVGISGGSIVSAEGIEIGDGTLIGANTTIIDTDFHPIQSPERRYDKENIRSKKVMIGKNVFIGANCIILKGSVIPDNSIVPAGSVVRSNTKLPQ